MLILHVTFHCRAGGRDAYFAALQEAKIGELSRADEGNIKYDYYYSTADPDEILLVEKWENEELLKKHLAQPHLVKSGELKKQYGVESVLEKFEVR